MRILVLVEARTEHRVEEALRAALGLTLRGAAVAVRVAPTALTGALARRAAATLTMFGHEVGARVGRLAEAEAVEVWTDSEPEPDSETDSEPEPDSGPETGAGTDSETETDSEPEPEPDSEPETGAGAGTDSETDSEPGAEPGAGTDSEVETGGCPEMGGRVVLHLVRRGGRPQAVAARDWIVDLEDPPIVRAHGSPPLPAGALSLRQLRDLVAAAALVITW